ncbi:accessory Sec system protein Asp3 [Streptococcus sp. SGI.013]|uniref:accessory Sec system protein Asp3 n=1 Tax=unclassified Streptococcus TaxID=2608887 RepID=UPI003D06B4D7
MTRELIATIKWDKVATSSTYLYGSIIRFVGESVRFENLLMPPGKEIYKWMSRTNYQRDRRTPELPVLEFGKTYTLVANMDVIPNRRVFVKIEFFNRLGESIAVKNIRDEETSFTYPEGAFSYTITLMSGGCQALYFTSLELYQEKREVSPFTKKVFSKRYIEKELPEELNFVSSLIETI